MKKMVVGYIFSEKKLSKDEKAFIKQAKKKNISLVLINLLNSISEEELRKKIAPCDVVFNNSGEDFAIELIKTMEEMGAKVIEPSKSYYYCEDKWMFYLNCKKHNIPMLKTILLSENTNIARKELEEFNQWPVVLKRVCGTRGEYVEKADNVNQAISIMEKFWKKGSERLPIIAQEFVLSPSHRVTVIEGIPVQTAIKKNHGWKATGVYAKKIGKFEVDNSLHKIISKLSKHSGMTVYGVDLLKKENKWLVLEINCEPAFDFFENQRESLIGKVLDALKKKI